MEKGTEALIMEHAKNLIAAAKNKKEDLSNHVFYVSFNHPFARFESLQGFPVIVKHEMPSKQVKFAAKEE